MNIKEAFRYQNKLKQVLDMTNSALGTQALITSTKTKFLYSKVNPDAQDEVIETTAENDSVFAKDPNATVEFAMFILDEREKLNKAIADAKASSAIDIDSEVDLNVSRRALANTLRYMAGIKSSSTTVKNGGTGYKFNADGEQVSYRCDIDKVTTINFDRNKVKKLASDLGKEADSISTKLDASLITTEVSYEPPFDVNDDIQTIFEDFLEKRAKE